MARTFYCGGIRGIDPHRWTAESSPLRLDHDNLFVQCPDHDDLPNAESTEHSHAQYFPESSPLLPR